LAGHEQRRGVVSGTGRLRDALADYLVLRRALGYRLVRPQTLLNQFLDYLEDDNASVVTVHAALSWARQSVHADANWWGYRLSVVRGFATYLHTLDQAHEVPAADLLPRRTHRATPYLYSDQDIAALVGAAQSLPTPLRRATFATLVGLLGVTGMRVGEAIALDRDDVDLNVGLLVVRHGKFDKARELVLHPSTSDALRRYLADQTRMATSQRCAALFVSNVGTRLLYRNVQRAFQQLVHIAGLPPRAGSCRPRIHDLRHSFAVRSMLDAYTAGQDGQARLALISTYLGHVHPTSTYWYLSASPELMAAAGKRLETHLAGRP
jgi:integrase